MPAPRVLLLATTTGYQTRSFGEAAERLGVDLVLATDRCKTLDDPWRDRAVPIRFHDEPGSVDAVVREAARAPFAGLLALGDRPVAIAARVAAALGLPHHPVDAARAAHNKRLARERLRAAGLPVPWFASYPVADPRPLGAGEVPLPCVIKPLVLSGSRGVIRANTLHELRQAHARLAALLRSRAVRALRNPDADAILVEQYIPGEEYAIEGLMERGVLRVLAIFDKPDPLEGPFFEETIYVTPSRAADGRQALDRARDRGGRRGARTASRPHPRGVPRDWGPRVHARSGRPADRRTVRARAPVRERRYRDLARRALAPTCAR